MENKRLFYIVVPVYKTEKYLMDCCLSVKNQTYSNWILILVDDGSPDKSGQICDELAKNDNRIHVIHQENKGLVAARMAGNTFILSHKKQESFVISLDSDDSLLPFALETLNDTINRDESDIVVYGCQKVNNGEVIQGSQLKGAFYGVISDKRQLYKVVFSEMYYNSLCLKCISADLLRDIDYSQFFHIRHGEDLLQSINYYKQCRSVSFIDSVLYNYTVNPESITHTVNIGSLSINGTVRSLVWDFLKGEGVWTEDDFSEYAGKMLGNLSQHIVKIACFPTSYSKKSQMYEAIRNNPYFSTLLKYPSKNTVIKLFKYKMDWIIVLIDIAKRLYNRNKWRQSMN